MNKIAGYIGTLSILFAVHAKAVKFEKHADEIIRDIHKVMPIHKKLYGHYIDQNGVKQSCFIAIDTHNGSIHFYIGTNTPYPKGISSYQVTENTDLVARKQMGANFIQLEFEKANPQYWGYYKQLLTNRITITKDSLEMVGWKINGVGSPQPFRCDNLVARY